jgi:hypothetical protein
MMLTHCAADVLTVGTVDCGCDSVAAFLAVVGYLPTMQAMLCYHIVAVTAVLQTIDSVELHLLTAGGSIWKPKRHSPIILP